MSVNFSIYGKSFKELEIDYKAMLSMGNEKIYALNGVIDVAEKVLQLIKSNNRPETYETRTNYRRAILSLMNKKRAIYNNVVDHITSIEKWQKKVEEVFLGTIGFNCLSLSIPVATELLEKEKWIYKQIKHLNLQIEPHANDGASELYLHFMCDPM